MLDVKKISAMLLATILVVACKKTDEKSKLPPVKEKIGWICPEGVGDEEWVSGYCFGDDTTKQYYYASIYALLSNPKFFDKKLVHTCGYLSADMTVENCSIIWNLYPHKEDILHNLHTNQLRIEKIENEYEDVKAFVGTEIFRHMVLPYGMYVCFSGMFSSYVGGIGRGIGSMGFVNGSIYNVDGKLSTLNKKLDSLLKGGEDISEYQWSCPCEPFEIQKGKIKIVEISSDCHNASYYERRSCGIFEDQDLTVRINKCWPPQFRKGK